MLSPKSKQGRRPILYLRNANVQWGRFDLGDVAEMDFSEREESKFARNALFNEDGEWIHQNHIIRVRLDRSAFVPEFVSRYLNSDAARAQLLEKAKTTTGLYTLSTGKVAALLIPQPSSAEQHALAARLRTEFEQAQPLREHLSQKLAAVEKLPAALLREAFSGRRDLDWLAAGRWIKVGCDPHL